MKLRTMAFWLILLTIFLGGIIPFAAQFLFPALFKDYSPVGAEIWNQYVSIILGIVATALSIISLVLCFRSEDRSQTSNNQLQLTFEKLKEKVEDVGRHQMILEEKFSQIVPQVSAGAYIKKDVAISHKPVTSSQHKDENLDI